MSLLLNISRQCESSLGRHRRARTAVQDMADALELLRESDPASATAALRRIFRRWTPLAHLQIAN